MISNGDPTNSVVTASPGPITLPPNATLVSDADDEIFLLYTRLAALKPADSSDTGHFHGLGSENPNQDSLHVCIELKRPITCEPPRNTETGNQRRKRRKGSGAAKAKEERRGHDPIVFEYVLFQDQTALRSRSGDTGSVLWKTRWASPFPHLSTPDCCLAAYLDVRYLSVCLPSNESLSLRLTTTSAVLHLLEYFSIEFLSLVLQQQHFPERRRDLFDYAKLSQAHVLELGCVAAD